MSSARPQAFGPGTLEGGVRIFWAVDACATAPRRALPDGCVDLVFHFTASRQVPRAAVLGPMSRPHDIPPEAIERIGLSMVPGEALPVIGVPLGELKDRIVDLRELWGREADVLFDALAACGTHRERVEVMTRALRARYERSRADRHTRLVRAALATLNARPVTSVAELASAVGASERHLERAFRERVGLSPKVMSRIERLHRAISRAGQLSWAQLACELDFTDQAHLIREFRALTGDSPASFVREVAVSGFYNLSEG
jgi:AraC-like DNA-binding protein